MFQPKDTGSLNGYKNKTHIYADVAHTNQPPGTETGVCKGRGNVSGRVWGTPCRNGPNSPLAVLSLLFSMWFYSSAHQNVESIFLFLESGLILFPLTPRIWWKRCGVISKPKRPHTLACSLGPLPATWEPALITSWKTGDCASHCKLSKTSWSQLTWQLNALAWLTPRRTAQPGPAQTAAPQNHVLNTIYCIKRWVWGCTRLLIGHTGRVIKEYLLNLWMAFLCFFISYLDVILQYLLLPKNTSMLCFTTDVTFCGCLKIISHF